MLNQSKSAQVTRKDARHVLRCVLNYPIFVPDLGSSITRLIVAGDLSNLLVELQRLSSLGSRPASVLLAYLCMKGAFGGPADLKRAEQLCTEAACSGDPYGQYVKGWICRVTAREAEAMNWLRKAAAKGLFLPAMVDAARFMIGGVGVEAPDARAALAVLWDAHRLGHRMALVYVSEIFRHGYMGWIGRLLGSALYPIAVARATRFANRNPLSDRVFVTSASTKQPLFKVTVAPK